jgi:hypothetical protein
MKNAVRAKNALRAASRMNSHFHPAMPANPVMPEKTPAAIRPEKACARTRPEYRIAVRRASSLRVYQHDIR